MHVIDCNVLCYTRSDGCTKTCIDFISIPIFLSFLFFMYPVYNRALNLKLNNPKFIFVFFYLVNITFKIFFAIASIFLISVDDAICIIMTIILTQ